MNFLERKQALKKKLEGEGIQQAAAVEAEIVQLNQPDNIPHDVWNLIQENGRLATERLNELLNSQRFHRLKASDQAKLIQLAQDRAYGRPDPGVKRSIKTVSHEMSDATAASLRALSGRMTLPEYSLSRPALPGDRSFASELGNPSQTSLRPSADETEGEQLE